MRSIHGNRIDIKTYFLRDELHFFVCRFFMILNLYYKLR